MGPSSHQESHRLQRLLGLAAILALAEWAFIDTPAPADTQAAGASAPTVQAVAPAASSGFQVVTLR